MGRVRVQKKKKAEVRDDAYMEAVRYYEEGRYEEALTAMRRSRVRREPEGKEFMANCKHFLVEQCTYVIKELIAGKEYEKAWRTYEELAKLCGEKKMLREMLERMPRRVAKAKPKPKVVQPKEDWIDRGRNYLSKVWKKLF
jgi:hypothetical protein